MLGRLRVPPPPARLAPRPSLPAAVQFDVAALLPPLPPAAEPVLASFAHMTVIMHSSLQRSLAFILANKLQSSTLLGTQLTRLFVEAYEVRGGLLVARLKHPCAGCQSHCLCSGHAPQFPCCARRAGRIPHRLTCGLCKHAIIPGSRPGCPPTCHCTGPKQPLPPHLAPAPPTAGRPLPGRGSGGGPAGGG